MNIDLFPLLQFLTDHAQSEALLPDAWNLVREIAMFAQGTSLEHPFGPRHIDTTLLSDAVTQVTGRPVTRVAVVQLMCAMPNPAHMLPAAFRSPFEGPVAPREDVIEKSVAVALYETVMAGFAEPMEDAIAARLGDSPWSGFAAAIANDMVDALYAYLTCIVANDAVGALAHQLYLECAAGAMLVGELGDKPGTWVALAA